MPAPLSSRPLLARYICTTYSGVAEMGVVSVSVNVLPPSSVTSMVGARLELSAVTMKSVASAVVGPDASCTVSTHSTVLFTSTRPGGLPGAVQAKLEAVVAMPYTGTMLIATT